MVSYNLKLDVTSVLDSLMTQSSYELEPKLCCQFIEMIKCIQIFKL